VRPVDLSQVIGAAVDVVRPAADARGISLQVHLDPVAEPVSGDAARLQQVVWNLLTNAVKFTPEGGRVQISLVRTDTHVRIVVSDTGQGIGPEILPHVFERFRQADSSSTRAYSGLGLGLAIVRHLVELHGGTVTAESLGAGQGSTFTVSFPLRIEHKAQPTDTWESGSERQRDSSVGAFHCPPELEGLHVLVVDDEEDARTLLSAVLVNCGARVRTAASVREALEELKRSRFDVLLSDIGMPEEDGYALIRKVRRLPKEEGGQIPAAALTAYARAEDRLKALRSGFKMHVVKPVEPAELVTVVANLAGRHEPD
jgi:CheY-like chemotaxis protein/anti-sigma regulatory factor (Ser/Thr protein kinase)